MRVIGEQHRFFCLPNFTPLLECVNFVLFAVNAGECCSPTHIEELALEAKAVASRMHMLAPSAVLVVCNIRDPACSTLGEAGPLPFDFPYHSERQPHDQASIDVIALRCHDKFVLDEVVQQLELMIEVTSHHRDVACSVVDSSGMDEARIQPSLVSLPNIRKRLARASRTPMTTDV